MARRLTRALQLFLYREERVVWGPPLLPKRVVRALVIDRPALREAIERIAAERNAAIGKVRREAEGSDVTVPAGFDAGAVRLTGRVTGAPPYRGTLRHPGWTTTKVELPRWTGEAGAARVIAPAEVEIP